jgi:ribosomal protein L29
MRAEAVRKLSAEELAAKEVALREEIARLGLKRHAHRLEKSADLGKAKKNLARVLTIAAERAGEESNA